MIKRFRKYISLSIIIFILIAFSSISIYAWDNCPFGLEDDPYPGECNRYIDTDGDGICDLSQPAPEDQKILLPTIVSNTINAAPLAKSSDSLPKSRSLPDYNFLEIFFITLLIYFSGKFLARKLKIDICQERKFWNTLLLISFIGSAGTGMILVFIRDFEWFKSINFNFLFWHVEFSIVMALLSVIHTLWHLKYYLSIFSKRNKKNNTRKS